MKFAAEFVQCNGVRLAYTAVGETGAPLVFLHGWADSRTIWYPSLKYFANLHRSVAVDLPGFGQSDKPDGYFTPVEMAGLVLRAIRILGRAPATLIGHSLGGIVALALTLENPEVVSRLVLVNPANSGQLPRAFRLLYTRRSGAVALNLLRATESAIGYLAPVEGGGRLGAYLRRARSTRLAPRRTLLETLGGVMRTDLRGRLGEVRAPTLVITGERDHTTPPAGAREIAEAIPGAQLIVFRGVGHHPMDERPGEFLRVVDEWLNLRSALSGQ